MSSNKRVTSLLVLLLALSAICSTSAQAPTPAGTPSGCEVCRDTKDCSKAYQSTPGQYCGAWLSNTGNRMACCCAAGDVCDLGNYSCNCKRGKATPAPPKATAAPVKNAETPAPKKDSKKTIIIAVVVVIALGLIGLGIYFYMKSRNTNDEEEQKEVYVQEAAYTAPPPQPVYTQPPPPQPVYTQPAPQPVVYTSQPAYTEVHHHHHEERRGGMSAGAGVAVGAAAGLVGGALIGHALADHGSDNHTSYSGGGGYSGGYDDSDSYAGDF